MWQVIDRTEWREVGVFEAGAKILPLRNALVCDPILRESSPQLAFTVPFAASSMLQILTEVRFLADGFLFPVKPPFETVPATALYVAGFREDVT